VFVLSGVQQTLPTQARTALRLRRKEEDHVISVVLSRVARPNSYALVLAVRLILTPTIVERAEICVPLGQFAVAEHVLMCRRTPTIVECAEICVRLDILAPLDHVVFRVEALRLAGVPMRVLWHAALSREGTEVV